MKEIIGDYQITEKLSQGEFKGLPGGQNLSELVYSQLKRFFIFNTIKCITIKIAFFDSSNYDSIIT